MAKFRIALRRQLPQITLRLQQTLESCRRRGRRNGVAIDRSGARTGAMVDGVEAAACQRCRGLRADGAQGRICVAPLALYDSVAENLLQNALAKRQQEDAVSIRVFLVLLMRRSCRCATTAVRCRPNN